MIVQYILITVNNTYNNLYTNNYIHFYKLSFPKKPLNYLFIIPEPYFNFQIYNETKTTTLFIVYQLLQIHTIIHA